MVAQDQQEQQEYHWDSMLMTVNPERIKEHTGIITAANYNENALKPTKEAPSAGTLILTITKDSDSLENRIIFCDRDYSCEIGENPEYIPIQEGLLPEVVQGLYEDFNVNDASELVGRKVVGNYFLGRLAGICKAS